MKIIEQNVMNSFRLAKTDIIQMQNELIELRKEQEELLGKIAEIESGENWILHKMRDQLRARIREVKKSHKHPVRHNTYVASKNSKRFHKRHCPFAQNIKPKTKIVFKTRAKALNKGLRPCKCVR
ncbi:hypothetical protein KY345_03475 [Candidatus Woesearchaeota archaeon]|nr:hypothetical protein [Candidatus Woesearchaeota archaeon]